MRQLRKKDGEIDMTWKLIRNWKDSKIWESRKDPSLTLEMHQFDEPEDENLDGKWYVFPAKDGKGIPSSPEIVEKKSEAIREIARLKKEYSGFKQDIIRASAH
jgi:hypothetical protein